MKAQAATSERRSRGGDAQGQGRRLTYHPLPGRLCATSAFPCGRSAPACSTAINAEQLVTGIMINLCIGALCYVGFVLWRGRWVRGAVPCAWPGWPCMPSGGLHCGGPGPRPLRTPSHSCLPTSRAPPTSFRVYFGRLVSPFVSPAHRPPALRLGSHWQLWSWLLPVFNVSDQRLLETVGLDALVGGRAARAGARSRQALAPGTCCPALPAGRPLWIPLPGAPVGAYICAGSPRFLLVPGCRLRSA